TSVLAVVRGDCCGASRTSAVVGEASMASGTCELTLDYDKVSAYPAGSTYHVCVWDSADDTVCTTVSEALVSTNCTRGGGAGRELSRGAVAGVVVFCLILCCCLVCVAVWRLRYWRRETEAEEEVKVEVEVEESGEPSVVAKPSGCVVSKFRLRSCSPDSSFRSCSGTTSLAGTEVTLRLNPLLVSAAYNSGAALLPDDLPIIPVTVDEKTRNLPKLEWEHRRRLAAHQGEAWRVLQRLCEAERQEVKTEAVIVFNGSAYPSGCAEEYTRRG
ncbi:hypothetical protein IOCL1545_000065600, partial [Leishmania shawi]